MSHANLLIDERGLNTLYGEWQDDFLLYVPGTGFFERHSKTTANIYARYSSHSEMLASVLAQECRLLQSRFDNDDRHQ